MVGTTFSSAYTSTVTLTSADIPAYFAPGASVSIATGYTAGVAAPAGYTWSITNSGSIYAFYGLSVGGSGTVINNAVGHITGRRDGVRSAYNSLTVVNAGYIAPTKTIGIGVELRGGGRVVNASGGTIAGVRGAVYLRGGYVTNAAGGTIDGLVQIVATTGTLINAGSINTGGTAITGVDLQYGGIAANYSGAVINGGLFLGATGVVANAGSINAGQANYGVQIANGEVNNLATGVINASPGFGIGLTTGIVNNAGMVSAKGSGVIVHGFGTVDNTGSIAARYGAGVSLGDGGVVTNAAGKTINSQGTAAIAGSNAPATITNYGTLLGSTEVYLAAGGTVTNAAGGVFGATTGFGPSAYGVDIRGAVGTVFNAGIIGAHYHAIALRHGGYAINSIGATLYAHGTGIYFNYQGTVTSTASARGTAVNDGTITAVNGGILLAQGGFASNAATGVITTFEGYGMAIGAYGGTMVNAGRINQTYDRYAFTGGIGMGRQALAINQTGGTIIGFMGAWIDFGGAVTNEAGAVITGADFGIYAHNNVVTPVTIGTTVDNFGTINSQFFGGIQLQAGGTITNQPGALITGPAEGIEITNFTATVVNDGIIAGNEGFIVNDASATSANTLLNAGTIIGTLGVAVSFGSGNDRLIVAPGAVFQGTVSGGGGINTLELTGSSAGYLSGLGSSVTNFGSIVFDSGAHWTIASNAAGVSGTVAGFAPGDVIHLVGLNETISSYAAGTLSLTGTQPMSIVFSAPANNAFIATPAAGGTDISLACFAQGTCIDTPNGPIRVEHLSLGDRVSVIGNRTRRVEWLGRRQIDCARHPVPRRVQPVRIKAGAFGNGLPRRDLRLSPDHAVYLEGLLIPIRCLINHRTIVWEPIDRITWYHVELVQHDVLLAEGLPAESYLDIGDRADFDNAGSVVRLFPDLSNRCREATRLWEAHACAPLVVSGPAIDAIRKQLAAVVLPDRDICPPARSA
jgi:hypothetical protein